MELLTFKSAEEIEKKVTFNSIVEVEMAMYVHYQAMKSKRCRWLTDDTLPSLSNREDYSDSESEIEPRVTSETEYVQEGSMDRVTLLKRKRD
jgi:hypothetical protein